MKPLPFTLHWFSPSCSHTIRSRLHFCWWVYCHSSHGVWRNSATAYPRTLFFSWLTWSSYFFQVSLVFAHSPFSVPGSIQDTTWRVCLGGSGLAQFLRHFQFLMILKYMRSTSQEFFACPSTEIFLRFIFLIILGLWVWEEGHKVKWLSHHIAWKTPCIVAIVGFDIDLAKQCLSGFPRVMTSSPPFILCSAEGRPCKEQAACPTSVRKAYLRSWFETLLHGTNIPHLSIQLFIYLFLSV